MEARAHSKKYLAASIASLIAGLKKFNLRSEYKINVIFGEERVVEKFFSLQSTDFCGLVSRTTPAVSLEIAGPPTLHHAQ